MRPNSSLKRHAVVTRLARMLGPSNHACQAPNFEFHYALNGFSSETPKALKSATFLVTTVKP